MSDADAAQFTPEDQEFLDAFLAETTLFLGPDPEIMNDHRMARRTATEDRLLSGPIDPNDLDRVRKRIVAGLDEAFEMMEQTGAAPAAKWGGPHQRRLLGVRRPDPHQHRRGDVLERDPEAVMADVEAGYLSSETAREIYFVIHDPATLAVDTTGTGAARAAERQARLRRGTPYTEFVKAWATPEPPAHLPYYGSWGDDNGIIHATAWTTHGPVRVAAPADQLPQIFLPDPNVVALAAQQARIAELETRVSELEGAPETLLAEPGGSPETRPAGLEGS